MTHEHLTDEQISAFIDGEGADDAELFAQCQTCRQRRDQLEAARALLRVPVTPVAPAVRAAAVAAALAGAEAGNETEPDSAASAGRSAVGDAWRRPPRRRRSGELVGSVAAVVVVLGLAVGIPLGLSHGGGSSPSASPAARAAPHEPAKKSASSQANRSGTPSALSAGTAARPLPDLGSINSTTSLRRRLSSAQQQALREGPANTASGTGKSGTTDQAAAPSFATSGLAPAVTTCVAAARAVAGSSDPLLLVATVRYRDTPALAVLVQTPAPGAGTTTGRRVVVVTRTDCRVLVVTKL